MGWFDEQIKLRKKNDDAIFEESFVGIADAVLGTKMSEAYKSDTEKVDSAIDHILRYYKIKPVEVPDNFINLNDRLEYLLRPNGIMRRNITLEKGWYKNAIGAILGTRKDDGSVVAFIPKGFTGYMFFDAASGKWIKLSKKNENLFETDAICFYKPFPLKKLTLSVLARYIIDTLSVADIVLIAAATLAVTAVGMLVPRLNNVLFGTVVENQSLKMLAGITVFMICVSVSSLLLQAVKSLFSARVGTRLDLSVQAATMMRILSLPADFFKQYGSGELSSRAQNIQTLCSMLVSTVFNTGLTSIFSLLYITQIFTYTPTLVVPALIIILVTVVFSLVTSFLQMHYSKKQMELGAQENGMSYALISGIQKIRLSGSEKRAYSRWSSLYAKVVRTTYNTPMFLRINGTLGTAISLIGVIVMYYMSVKSKISVADYYSFNSAYGMLSGAFMSLAGIATTIARFKPIIEMAKPIMEAVPEVSEGKLVIDRLSCAIELNNVSFRYSENMPLVIDDLSLKIRAGQYVAIVGATGCGKSTLMRILLGFEKPQKGAVYYDGKDLDSIDLRSLRRKIGVVLQNGKLFQGNIYSNIVISAPHLSLDDAWDAAEMAGIADDIRKMP
ncbi:MAG: ATP-binding cassette domain-containing protein, partial [Clostridia bacterium]|nr:ATP-binding cassette domain-containing protein [Clostridia bacterium]